MCQNLVQEYVQGHGLETQFKKERPGYKWIRNFMRRNNLTMKKAEMISSARMGNTANPFIINDFYDLLEKVIYYISKYFNISINFS